MAIDDVDDDPTVGGDQAPGAFREAREVGQFDLPDRGDLGRRPGGAARISFLPVRWPVADETSTYL